MTPDNGTVMYVDVVQYTSKAKRFLVHFVDDDDEHFTRS